MTDTLFYTVLTIVTAGFAICIVVVFGLTIVCYSKPDLAIDLDQRREEKAKKRNKRRKNHLRQHLPYDDDIVDDMMFWCETHINRPLRFHAARPAMANGIQWARPYIDFSTSVDLVHFRLAFSKELVGIPAGRMPRPMLTLARIGGSACFGVLVGSAWTILLVEIAKKSW